jgi:hypothetical protein
MDKKPETGGLAALLRKDKEQKQRRAQEAEASAVCAAPRREKMRLGEAARYLGVSAGKVRRLVEEGRLGCDIDPLDKRRRLVKVAELERLKQSSG